MKINEQQNGGLPRHAECFIPLRFLSAFRPIVPLEAICHSGPYLIKLYVHIIKIEKVR